MKFLVQVREVHVSTLEVEATSKEDALDQVRRDGTDAGEEINLEYSHTLDSDNWTVEGPILPNCNPEDLGRIARGYPRNNTGG